MDVQGSDVREIEVIADPARLMAHGLSYTDLSEAIRRAVTVQAVGRVAQNYRQYLIVTDQEAHAAGDIGNVVVRGGLHVRDVATVQLGTEDHVRIIAAMAGPQPSSISRANSAAIRALADSVAESCGRSRLRSAGRSPQARLRPSRAGPRAVWWDAMLIGAALAVVCALFLPWRITAISA